MPAVTPAVTPALPRGCAWESSGSSALSSARAKRQCSGALVAAWGQGLSPAGLSLAQVFQKQLPKAEQVTVSSDQSTSHSC